MSERMLSAIQTIEKGGRPVFPLMPFSSFPEYMALLRKALEKKETKALIKKQEFLDFISAEQRRGAVRFSLGFNSKGEIVLHWTNEAGLRVWSILSGNRGKSPSRANRERMSNLRRWLHDARQGMEGDTPEAE